MRQFESLEIPPEAGWVVSFLFEITIIVAGCGSQRDEEVFSYHSIYKGQKYTVIGAISVNDSVCLKIVLDSMKEEYFLPLFGMT
ncbi:MAG: hypothetical protein HC919_10905 [Oscillatoriales cyanobacterium SM2_2_1]|nr:hypothetical protein [Oscillatoriales cyanobacterium SM2_2_1]